MTGALLDIGRKFMYMVCVPPAAIAFSPRFTHIIVFDAVLLVPFSIHAYSTVPVFAGPVVNSTFDRLRFSYDAHDEHVLDVMLIICWKSVPVDDDCELVNVIAA